MPASTSRRATRVSLGARTRLRFLCLGDRGAGTGDVLGTLSGPSARPYAAASFCAIGPIEVFQQALCRSIVLSAGRPAAARQISRTATMPKLEKDHSRNSEPTQAATSERRGPRRWTNCVEKEGRLASDAARPVDIGFQSHRGDQVEDCWGGRKRSGAKALFLPRVEKALAYVAHLIETRPEGESYWPIFDRLEHEREQLASRADRLSAAKARI